MSVVYRNIREQSLRRPTLICLIHLILFPSAAHHTVCSPHPSPPHCTPSVTQPITEALVLGRLMASLHRI